MIDLIVAVFPESWAIVGDLTARTLRLLQGRRPPYIASIDLDPLDAARLDLGGYVPGLCFDWQDQPVVIFANDGNTLIWVCTRGECAWIGDTA